MVSSECALSFPLFVKLCSDKVAFEARTSRKLCLNMAEVKQALERTEKYKILVETPHMLILKGGEAETTLSKDGRMLIKKVSNEAEATEVARQIVQAIFKEILRP